MAKKSTQQSSAHRKFVTTVGYILFGGMVLGVITGAIIPFAHMFSSPHVRTVNVMVFMASLIVSALLPAVIAYAVGSASTRSKNHQLHHYNGVMFGLLAYWINVVAGMINADFMHFFYTVFPTPVNIAVGFMAPVTITALAVGAIAYYYHRGGGGQVDLTDYRPFQFGLVGLVALYAIGLPFQQFASGYWSSVTVIELGLLLAAYICLMKMRLNMPQKLTLATAGTTLALITQYVVGQFLPDAHAITGDVWSISAIILFLTSFMVWALYLYITRFTYRK